MIARSALRPAARKVGLRFLSSAPQFDAEMSALYSKIAENHHHPAGPWPLMLAAVKAANPASLIDLATGPGQPAMTIAQAMPSVEVTATDVSPDMVATASKSAAGVPNMEVKEADLEDLSQFPDGSFDTATCCYGYMFPTDKPKALSETFRVLKPGGTLVGTTWDRVDMLEIVRDVMTDVLGGEAPPPPPLNPMSLSEPNLFESLVADAGFVDVEVSRSTYPFNFGAEPDFQQKMGLLLVKDKLEELGKRAEAEEAFWRHVGKYTEKNAAGELIMPANTFKLLVAKRPE